MDEMMEVLEENLNRISVLSNVLFAASLGDEIVLNPRSLREVSNIINELADKSLEAMNNLQPAEFQRTDRPV